MHKLFGKIKKLRTNENILIAVDALYNSKTSFMNIFLMSFMIMVSLKSSPMSYLSYQLSHYAFNGILCVLLADVLRSHPLNAWRVSMFFSIVQILAIIFLDANFLFYPLVIGFLSGLEAQLYWRPKDFLEIKEVSNNRRDKFSTARNITVEIVKIAMPVILGIVISDSGYTRAANIILVISIVQLLLSILLRPTHQTKMKAHSLRESLHFAVAHKSVRRTLWLQTLRGFALTGCAYGVVAQLNLYRSTSSNMELGWVQSVACLAGIVVLFLYRRFSAKAPAKKGLLIYSLMPAVIFLPIIAYMFPGNTAIAITLFIYYQGVVLALYNSSVFSIYFQNELKKSVHDDAYRIQIDILGELWLCVGRVIGIAPLLLFFYIGQDNWMLPFAAICALTIPIIAIIIRKSETSPALDKQ